MSPLQRDGVDKGWGGIWELCTVPSFFVNLKLNSYQKEKQNQDFPGGLVAKTPGSPKQGALV